MGDKFELSSVGRVIWEDRYALKDENGDIIEKDVTETFRRVAKAVASKEKDSKKWEEKFYDIMVKGLFCPAGRILAHSGTHYSQLLNCFVLPFENDSLESIMDTAKNMAITQKFGGGTGHSYSGLRPAGCYIKGVNGRSCGAVGFIGMMSVVSEVIEQGGTRRGANMGALEVRHPDIWEFISYKNDHNWDRLLDFMEVQDEEKWKYFKYENLYKWQMYNVSVAINDDFLEALDKDEVWPFMWEGKEWELYKVVFKEALEDDKYKEKEFEVTADCDATAIWKVKRKIPFPRGIDKFEVISRRKVKASEIWDLICYNAWADGCPGIINLSEMRRMHNLEYTGTIDTANPCGEQPLPANASCNLSSISLLRFVNKELGIVNFDLLGEVVRTAVRFSDDVIDNCEFPIPAVKEKALKERRVGLGTMGVHDMLIELNLGYDTEEGRNLVEEVLTFIRNEAYKASVELAKEKGCFPVLSRTKFMKSGFIKTLPKEIQKLIELNGTRNGTLLSQAPAGSIGAFLSVSSGCEPWPFLSFIRNTRLGSYEDGCAAYLKWKEEHPNEPKPLYFKEAQEISPEDHVKMMIIFSKYMDSAVSKTINLPNKATVADIKEAFLFALRNGVKGLTVFRDGSKEGVLIDRGKKKLIKEAKKAVHELQDMKEESVPESRMSPRKRGGKTVGSTLRIHMQKHNLYITVNRNMSGELVEVFATVGENKNENSFHTSGVEDSWAEGLAKMISLALRAGVDTASIIRNLKNIPSDKPVFVTLGGNETSELISSPPHAIARAIEEEMLHPVIGEKATLERPNCENCGNNNTIPKSPTCYDCLDCGFKKCG
jgi:ribonucleoside-diphosphate reductase alpha chain